MYMYMYMCMYMYIYIYIFLIHYIYMYIDIWTGSRIETLHVGSYYISNQTGALIVTLRALSATGLLASGNFFSTQDHAAAGIEKCH